MRVVSLLPAGTEIVGALGRMDTLLGVSHECSWPPEAREKPRVTRCEIYDAGLSSQEIDRRVREAIATRGSLYELDEPLLRELRPDLILTQQLCDACAIGYGSVAGMAAALPSRPRLLNLEPACLADVFGSIRDVAEALNVRERGDGLVRSLRARVDAVRERAARAATRPTCLMLEWIDPPFCAGHWNPELVAVAGGEDPLGRPGCPSVTTSWQAIREAAPEIIVVACCGYTPERASQDLPLLRDQPGWASLPAVREGRVYLVDGNAYFTCPGPRLVDGLEILAEIVHPELFAGCFPERDVVQLRS